MQEEVNDKALINDDELNPVDFCNFYKIQEVFDKLQTIKPIQMVAIDALTYYSNKSDIGKRMVVLQDGYFICEMQGGFDMELGKKYTPFMMLQKFFFRGNFTKTLGFVIHEYMCREVPFVRVGVKYYKKIIKLDSYNIKRVELKLWDKSIIRDDYGSRYLNEIEAYDDFTMEPNNKNYAQVIGNNYNLYSPFAHTACSPDEDYSPIKWPCIDNMIMHIFSEQYDLGLKYLKVLYEFPKKILPILVLTSTERQTGKTTFAVDFMHILFGANMVAINPKDISNDFNGSYADKNIISIEESQFESKQATEKLKNLATQKKIMVNTKHVSHYSVPFYGKLIITSNNEDKFSKVDNEEIRYWVRKVPTLKGKANHNILEDMLKEIPYFLRFLEEMDPIDFSKSRMVFTEEEISTQALDVVKKESRSWLCKDLEMIIDDHCLNNTGVKNLHFTPKCIKEKFFKSDNRVQLSYLRQVIRDEMKIKKIDKNIRFISMEEDGGPYGNKSKSQGRPFIFENPYYEQKIE